MSAVCQQVIGWRSNFRWPDVSGYSCRDQDAADSSDGAVNPATLHPFVITNSIVAVVVNLVDYLLAHIFYMGNRPKTTFLEWADRMIPLLGSERMSSQQWFSRVNTFLVRLSSLYLYLAHTNDATKRCRRIWIGGDGNLARSKSMWVSPTYWTMLPSACSHLGMISQAYSCPLTCTKVFILPSPCLVIKNNLVQETIQPHSLHW